MRASRGTQNKKTSAVPGIAKNNKARSENARVASTHKITLVLWMLVAFFKDSSETEAARCLLAL
jgi:hypothetical protein